LNVRGRGKQRAQSKNRGRSKLKGRGRSQNLKEAVCWDYVIRGTLKEIVLNLRTREKVTTTMTTVSL